MSKYKILPIGFEFPGGVIETVPFTSKQSLLDADIVIFQPTLGTPGYSENHQGKPALYESDSFVVREQLKHWSAELRAAVQAGKIVFVFLAQPDEAFAKTGQTQVSGTGRNQQVTHIVSMVSSYEAVPIKARVHASSGTKISPVGDLGYLSAYWKEFGSNSPYEVQLEGELTRVLLRTTSGERIVGGTVETETGMMILVPPVQVDEESFVAYNAKKKRNYWTSEAVEFGNRLVAAIVGVADAIRSGKEVTPPPGWVRESAFRMPEEPKLEQVIRAKTAAIDELREERDELETEYGECGSMRRLLYEKGPQLEQAVIEALQLLDFEAQPFGDGESEFDAVFVSPEGRFLGEAEGKDNRSINIDKLSQLERNLQEDFAREGVTEYAKGVLFGNGHRLTALCDRPPGFSDKCVSGAKRSKVALINTPDLFAAARYLRSKSDPDYAERCRRAILAAEGDIVSFPSPPDASAPVEQLQSADASPGPDAPS